MTVLESLSVADFRNYGSLSLEGLGPLTILVGPNGAGKTNLIEAIQMVCAGPSFRHGTFSQMIAQDATLESHPLAGDGPTAVVTAAMRDGERELEVSVQIREASRKYLINGNARKAAAVRDIVSTVTFTPDDLALVKGSMSVRRSALDSLGSRLSANYSSVGSDFTRVLRHKNRLLKDQASPEMIDVIDELVVTCGAQLTCLRLTLLKRFVPHVISRFEAITQGRERLAVRYRTSWGQRDEEFRDFAFDTDECEPRLTRDEAREDIARALEQRREEELRRGRALVGPQADRIEFLIDGRAAHDFASQGQQRTLVLAYKLGEALTIEAEKAAKPLLLLDDVMSELDEERRAALVEYLKSGAQTFITTTNLAYFDEALVRGALVVAVTDGALSEGDSHFIYDNVTVEMGEAEENR